MTRSKGPLPAGHTRRYPVLAVSDLLPHSSVVFGTFGTEPRCRLDAWLDLHTRDPRRCIVVEKETSDEIGVSGTSARIRLRDQPCLAALLPCNAAVYIDISSLPHHVWGPVLRAALGRNAPTYVVYAEPASYKPHPSPASPTLFDLSEELRGLAPIPGFAQLSGPPDEDRTLFVPFLGFEGSRPRHLALGLDPMPKVIPVIGVPGFRLEYPAFTVSCNRELLDEHAAHSEVRFARASCPFEAYAQLDELRRDYSGYYLYIAPVGTKPHALGALKFSLDHPAICEILYDHPVRKTGRTRGVGLVHVYDVGCL